MPICVLGEISGVAKTTIMRWETGRGVPTLYSFIDAINALGYDLVIVPKKDK